MGYYMAGDYYAAGGIFGSIVGAIGSVARAASGILPGPLGTAAGAVGAVLAPKKTTTTVTPPLALPPAPTGIAGQIAMRFGGLQVNPLAAAPGGAPLVSAPSGMGAPAGYHLNKSYSYARGMPAGSFYVKNRRMNPANPRALRRGIRREKAFIQLARHVLKGTGISVSRKSFARKTTRRR